MVQLKRTFLTFHISFTPLLYLYNTILCRDDHQPLFMGEKRRKYIPAKPFHANFIHVCMRKNLGTCVMNIRAGSTADPFGGFGLALSVILDFLWPCLILCFSPNTVIKRLSQPPALSFCDCVAAAHFSHASLRCQQGATCFTLNYCTTDSLRDPPQSMQEDLNYTA